MNDFLSFRKMITPIFIQIIFWFAVVMAVIAAFGMMFQGGLNILIGLIFLVVGPFMARIYCELLIIMFRIYDELVAIRTGTPPSGQGFPVMPPTYAAPAPGTTPPPGQPPMAR
jgi:hypothetical protein